MRKSQINTKNLGSCTCAEEIEAQFREELGRQVKFDLHEAKQVDGTWHTGHAIRFRIVEEYIGKRAVLVLPSLYCPFCGKKLENKKGASDDAP